MIQKKAKILSKYAIFFLFLATTLTAAVWFSLAGDPSLKDKAELFSVSLTLGMILALSLAYLFSELGWKMVRFLIAKRKQIMTMGIGWTVDQTINFAGDFLLYPFVIGYWGLMVGGGVMIILSLVISIGQIIFYDWAKKDWLGIEALKSIRDDDQKTRVGRIASWLMKKGDPVALIGLSIFYSEPVAITMYMRRGAYQYNGFSKRDWTIFVFSVLISNMSWALAVWGGLEAFQFLF